MKPIQRARFLALSLAILSPILLQGCSGGGGSGDGGTEDRTTAPPAPTATLTPEATKTFAFSWSDVSGETEYRLLENADGLSGYSEVAVIPADSSEHNLTVSLPQRMKASYILQACNNQGCTDSDEVFVTGSLAEATGYFKASNTDANAEFGTQVALSEDGRVMAVSAILEDGGATGINGDQSDDVANDSGAVYVFVQNDGSWSQQAYIKATNAERYDHFGVSLALSADGSVLAVGSHREESSETGIDGDQTDNSASLSGAVYVYTQSDGSWSQQGYIKASNTGAGDFFGISLALSSDGKVMAVGASREQSGATGVNGDQTDNSLDQSGSAYVFTESDGVWSQHSYIKASNPGQTDLFGSSLALSANGRVLAVGSPQEDSGATGIDGDQTDNSTSAAGAVYLFTQSGDTWSQQAYIKASNAALFDQFSRGGVALSSDGSVLAVGAIGEGSSATGINGDQTNNSASNSGTVYLFTQSSGTWSQQAYIKASNTEEDDQFGSSLTLSPNGRILAVAANEEDGQATGINGDPTDNSLTDSGAVYVFAQSEGVWSQQSYVKASNAGALDRLGVSSLALSEDGSVLAIGARDEDSSAIGINGDQEDNSASRSGAVYLY